MIISDIVLLFVAFFARTVNIYYISDCFIIMGRIVLALYSIVCLLPLVIRADNWAVLVGALNTSFRNKVHFRHLPLSIGLIIGICLIYY